MMMKSRRMADLCTAFQDDLNHKMPFMKHNPLHVTAHFKLVTLHGSPTLIFPMRLPDTREEGCFGIVGLSWPPDAPKNLIHAK